MPYRVTFETFETSGRKGPVGLDLGSQPKGFDLNDALNHARQLLQEKHQHVTISDDSGHTISGADLLACCEGKKTLTADLRAV
jgi:hypothetical protein